MSTPGSLKHPQTRAGRLAAIRAAIDTGSVGSQQQLSQILAEQGFDVTQATLSRDLDELQAVKVRDASGAMTYRLPNTTGPLPESSDALYIRPQMTKVLSGLVSSVASALNQVVVHTPSGAAQYVASVIDAEPAPEVLGTIAGDDTVVIILMGQEQATEYAALLLSIASGDVASA